MSIKAPGNDFSTATAFAAHIHPLTQADLAIVENGMAVFAPEWSVELHGICVEEATLVILPEDGDDARGPSFMISREPCGLRLDQVHWDRVTDLGAFASLNDILEILRDRLALYSCEMAPLSVTLH